MAPSSLLCQFLLISVMAIGTLLLMIVPNAQALECYSSLTPDGSAIYGEAAAAWELNPKFSIANGTNAKNQVLAMSIGNKITTQQCPVGFGYDWCATFHCAKLYGNNTVKACAQVPWGTNPRGIRMYFQGYCLGDPKFHAQFCNTDKCNDD